MPKKQKLILSPAEIKVIENNINLYPSNLTHSFEVSADELGLKKVQVQSYYYNHIKPSKTIMTVATVSGNYTLNNQKNAIRRNLTTLTDDDKYYIVVDLISKMNRQRKRDLVNVLFS